MAGVEARIQHLIHIGRKNGGVTREQVRKYVVDRGATPIDLVLTYFRLIQENIPILDPFQGMTFRRKGSTALQTLDHGGPVTADMVSGQTVARHNAMATIAGKPAGRDRSNA